MRSLERQRKHPEQYICACSRRAIKFSRYGPVCAICDAIETRLAGIHGCYRGFGDETRLRLTNHAENRSKITVIEPYHIPYTQLAKAIEQ